MELLRRRAARRAVTIGIHTAPPVSATTTLPRPWWKRSGRRPAYLAMGKMPVVLGGEHSVSVGPIRAYLGCFRRCRSWHLDGPRRSEDSFEGRSTTTPASCAGWSRGTPTLQWHPKHVGRRGRVHKGPAAQVIPAWEFMKRPETALEAVDRSPTRYTLRLRGLLRPGILPGNGHPEPGGPGWYETLDFHQGALPEEYTVGFDVNELRPCAGDKSSDFLAQSWSTSDRLRFFAEGRRRG